MGKSYREIIYGQLESHRYRVLNGCDSLLHLTCRSLVGRSGPERLELIAQFDIFANVFLKRANFNL